MPRHATVSFASGWIYPFAVLCFVTSSAVHASVHFQTIVLSGNHAPDTPAGTLFGDSFPYSAFESVYLNEQGEIAFIGSLLEGSGDVTRDNWVGIWSSAGGQMHLVARAGDQAPEAPVGAVFGTFFTGLRFNDIGQTAFVNYLKTGAGGVNTDNRDGVWVERAGGLDLIARTGEQAPGTPTGAVFESFETGPSLNNSGQVAFEAILRPFQAGVTFENWDGVWFDDGSELKLIARQQEQAPGLPVDVNFEEVVFQLGESGQVLVFSELHIDGTYDRGTWLYESASLQLLGLQSDPVPGEPATTTFWSLGTSFANAGQLTQLAVVRREGELDHSVWLVTSTGLTPLIQAGATAPGLPEGTVFDLSIGSVSQLQMLNTEMIALSAAYSPHYLGSTHGIWAGDPDDLSLIALGGQHAPGTPAGAIFLEFRHLSVNESGQVVFIGELATAFGGINDSNDTGIWAKNPDGELMLILREGDLFELSPGDIRTIESLGMTDINVGGTFAMTVHFTDDTSGIFTVTIPEPTALCLLLAGSLGLLGRRH